VQHELQLGQAEAQKVLTEYRKWGRERGARYEAAQQKLLKVQQPRQPPTVGGAAGLRVAAEAEVEAQAALQAATQVSELGGASASLSVLF